MHVSFGNKIKSYRLVALFLSSGPYVMHVLRAVGVANLGGLGKLSFGAADARLLLLGQTQISFAAPKWSSVRSQWLPKHPRPQNR